MLGTDNESTAMEWISKWTEAISIQYRLIESTCVGGGAIRMTMRRVHAEAGRILRSSLLSKESDIGNPSEGYAQPTRLLTGVLTQTELDRSVRTLSCLSTAPYLPCI